MGYVSKNCTHEIDESQFLDFKPGVGKIYTCLHCGAKVVRDSFWVSPHGKKVHRSKRARRRIGKESVDG